MNLKEAIQQKRVAIEVIEEKKSNVESILIDTCKTVLAELVNLKKENVALDRTITDAIEELSDYIVKIAINELEL